MIMECIPELYYIWIIFAFGSEIAHICLYPEHMFSFRIKVIYSGQKLINKFSKEFKCYRSPILFSLQTHISCLKNVVSVADSLGSIFCFLFSLLSL